MTDEIEKILNGPGYFRCKSRKCRMPKKDCVLRQAKGVSGNGAFKYIPMECNECPQGLAIKEELENMKEEVELCKDCNKTPAIINKHGRVIHGRCALCHKIQVEKTKSLNSPLYKPKEDKLDIPPSESGVPKKKEEKQVEENENIVVEVEIDPELYPDILEKLENAAVEDVRSPEEQALYYVIVGLKQRASVNPS